MTPCWLPVRVAGQEEYINFAWVRRLESLPHGRTRLHWARRHLDVDEHLYNLKVILAIHLDALDGPPPRPVSATTANPGRPAC